MKIIVEVERRMEVCYGEANSLRNREPGMADSPCEANLSIIVSCRNLVAQLVGGRSQSRHTEDGVLRAAEHGFHRAGESDRPSWSGRAGSSHLGDGAAVPTPVSSSGVVAGLLSLCASSPLTASGARAATRARWHPGGATRPPTYTCHGSRQNHPTMDGARGALLSLAAGFCLRGMEVRGGCSVISRGDW
jgi:hypothetical protein